ncbi:MAG: porin family protein [Flavobacteriaceae bacterium]|nr:porin family protein [Flavobacteriaceae bacterium]
MKKLLIFVFALVATSASAQYYVSVSGGAQMGSAGVLMGTELNVGKTQATNEYGSFGEGLNAQLRAGYFWNKTFGVELGLGYLHGADQIRDSYKTTSGVVTEVVDATAYARAYGLTAALVYNFNDNIYGKFGAAVKVGGKTVAELTRTTTTPVGPIVTTGEQEFKGRLPLGFIGAMGYKYKLTDKLNLFAELEYLGINVTRDKAEFTALTIAYPAAGPVPAGTWTLGSAPLAHPVFGTLYAPTTIEYVDTLPVNNTDPSKALSEVAPYSSFGLNIGITYTFGK